MVEIKQLQLEVVNGQIELLFGRVVKVRSILGVEVFKLSDGTGEMEGNYHGDGELEEGKSVLF